MEKTALVWRESVYTNNFKCNQCGKKLATSDGKLKTKRLLIHKSYVPFILCRNCRNTVARLEKVEAPEEMRGLQGNYEDFKKEKNKWV